MYVCDMSRDNWERLVATVLKREQIWQLFHQQSRSPSNISTTSSSDDFSGQFLNLESISVSPFPDSPPAPLTNPSVSQVNNNAAGPITRMLFSSWYRKRKSKDEYLVDEVPGDHLGQVRRFSPHELQVATENFSNKIKYGYYMVYSGRLADGFPVAVKRYRNRGNQSEELQFRKEVEINSITAAHPNILRMLGVCVTPKERMIVYPLMVNGSVESCLRGSHESQPPLNWATRKGIALAVARGLAYLHDDCERKIVHRDVKAANILLDEDFEAVIGDFELAVIMDRNVTSYSSTSVVGAIGHVIAPDHHTTYTWSERSDVLCYGIFLLELITGLRVFDLARAANDEDMKLLDWVKRNYMMKRKWMMIDADRGGDYMEEVVEQLMQISLICTQSNTEVCPKMSEVVRMLEVGDGLGERWKEWYEREVKTDNSSLYFLLDDDIASEQLSGPR